MKVICIGHVTYDNIFLMDKYPLENSKNKASLYYECGGGAAGNSSYLLGLWGIKCDICARIGNDYLKDIILRELNSVNVNTSYLSVSDSISTDKAVILANKNKMTRTVISNNHNKYNDMLSMGNSYDGILIDGSEFLTSQKVLRENPHALTIIDASKLTSDTICLAHNVTVLACSREFAEGFTKKHIDPNNFEQLKNIYISLEREFKNIIIITLDEYGSFTKIGDVYKLIPSIKVNTVDTTGAGDAFHAALMYFLLNNYDLESAVKLSNIAGAISTTKVGSKNKEVTLEKVLYYGGEDDII